MYLFTKNNPYKFAGENYISFFVMRLFFVILDTWSAVIIFFLFLVTAYIFIFFKLQNQVFIIIPPGGPTTKNY